jgi:hypothetical protein
MKPVECSYRASLDGLRRTAPPDPSALGLYFVLRLQQYVGGSHSKLRSGTLISPILLPD